MPGTPRQTRVFRRTVHKSNIDAGFGAPSLWCRVPQIATILEVVGAALLVHRLDQRFYVFGRGELGNAVAEIEHVT